MRLAQPASISFTAPVRVNTHLKMHMKHVKIFMAAAVLSASLISSATAASHKPASPARQAAPATSSQLSLASHEADSWKPDPALVASLAQETQVGGYPIRLPKGFTEVASPMGTSPESRPGFENHLYSATRRSDGTAVGLGLSIATPPPGAGTISLDDALESTLERKKQRWQNFHQSAIERGLINGLACERVYFKGALSKTPGARKAHGMAFVTSDGKKVVSFQAVDTEPYSQHTLHLIQASILTLHQ